MCICGLLGRKLGHSYSPSIHSKLGSYQYVLFEREPSDLANFLLNGDFHGLNVTIPYKKSVVPYCSELSETAKLLGSVNTLIRRKDGTIFGDNTDYYGFKSLVHQSHVNIRGKKALVLGSGGASVTVCAVLKSLGANVVVISRTGNNNYRNIHLNKDATIIVNTTPLGMYPYAGSSAVDLNQFSSLEAVYDLIYNPARTALLLQAEALGIPNYGGLHMLVAQAKRSSEQFQNRLLPDAIISKIEDEIRLETENIILIGMPGCGKSTVANALGSALKREVYDSDAFVENMVGMSVPEIIAQKGETAFRTLETEALRQLGQQSGIILSTGGGCVTRTENYNLLHQNGIIFWLQRDISLLPTDNRPLSQRDGTSFLYKQRKHLYRQFADYQISNSNSIEKTIFTIKETLL